METTLKIYQEFDLITDATERARVVHLTARMVEIEGSAKKCQMMAFVAEQEGLPRKTVERLYYAWRKDGVLALADKRKLRPAEAQNEVLPIFKTYAENDKNTSRGGWHALMRDLRSGKVFPFGTWRDLWAREHPYETVPETCPWLWVPRGWGYQNLMRLMQKDPDRLQKLAWNRQGQFAASKFKLPVLRSRLDLPVGAVYQADDVWHNINVFAKGINGTFQPLEFAFYDVASAYKFGSFMKPRTISYNITDGRAKANNLTEFQFRSAFAYVCCCIGFAPEGVRFCLERGSAAIRPNVQERIRQIPHFGELITIDMSGVQNTPAHKGLLVGNAGGNPRFKSLCEGSHNILHNASASLLGNRGRDAAHMHESHAALIRVSEKTIQKANTLNADLLDRLELGIMSWDKFVTAFHALESEVMERTDHRLEGWVNNEIVEYRDTTAPTGWRTLDYLRELEPETQGAIIAMLKADPQNLIRKRKMSRGEVWRANRKNLVKVPLMEVPQFLDPRDKREGKVGADGLITFHDQVYYPGQEMRYRAQYTDRGGIPHRLCPGEKVRYYWNPWGELAKMIWLVDESETVLGMCPLFESASWADPHSIEIAAGQQIRQIAEAKRDMAGRHAGEAAEKMAQELWNKAVLKTAQDTPVLVREAIHADDPIAFLEQMNNLQTTEGDNKHGDNTAATHE